MDLSREHGEHRSTITQAMGGDDIRMYLWQQHEPSAVALYVGLWATWWVNDTVPEAAKILLVTVPYRTPPTEKTALWKDLAWTILQLQSITADHRHWPGIYSLLRDEMQPRGRKPCANSIVYDTSQEAYNHRTLKSPTALEQYMIVREEDVTGSKPRSVKGLERVMYRVYRGRADRPQLQPLHVFVERQLPKNQHVGHMLQSEYGLAKESTLLAAVGEWKTWIVLTSDAPDPGRSTTI